MATKQMITNHNNQHFNYAPIKQETDWEGEDDGFDPFYASKFCETILEEFQNEAELYPDLVELRNFIKIAPKPENMHTLTAYLLNLRKKAEILRQRKVKQKKTYPCEECGKVFGWPTDLKRHVLIHSGLRPFSCKHCDSSFNRSWLLRKHVSRLHRGQEWMISSWVKKSIQ